MEDNEEMKLLWESVMMEKRVRVDVVNGDLIRLLRGVE